MIVSTVDFKKTCAVIAAATEKSNDILELKTNDEGTVLTLNVTDKEEYYLSSKFGIEQKESLHATVIADSFLKLISQMTTETLEFKVTSSYLMVKGNGSYKVPLIYKDEGALWELKPLHIDNVTVDTTMSGEDLFSILNINSSELSKATKMAKPVQELYYLDEHGCITFTTGACVNNFELTTPIKVLFNNKLVKLFKLFKSDASVAFKLGYDEGNNNTLLTKVSFETDGVKLTAITPSNDVLLAQVPVATIRSIANKTYPYSIGMNKEELIRAINRLLVFVNKNMLLLEAGKFSLQSSVFELSNSTESGLEKLDYSCEDEVTTPYTFKVPLSNLRDVLNTCMGDYVTLNFGDKRALVVVCNNVKHIIPEIPD